MTILTQIVAKYVSEDGHLILLKCFWNPPYEALIPYLNFTYQRHYLEKYIFEIVTIHLLGSICEELISIDHRGYDKNILNTL